MTGVGPDDVLPGQEPLPLIELPEVDRTRLDTLMSSANPNWETPDEFLSLVREVFGGDIGLDPCTTSENPTRAVWIRTPPVEGHDNPGGLDHAWETPPGFPGVYMNPPYGRGIAPWVRKARDEGAGGTEIIALLPARPDTKWFQDVWTAPVVCFWKGRLKFRGADNSAPFPSVVPYWGHRPARFVEVFCRHGHCVSPYQIK